MIICQVTGAAITVAQNELLTTGMVQAVPVRFCFWLPSVVQLLVFELVFWQKRYESQQPERNAKEGKRNEA